MLSNKVILVTGAFSGIGERLVELLMQQRAKVIAVGRNPTGRVPSFTGNYLPIVRDIQDSYDADEIVEFALDKFGHVDMMVCCAGSVLARPAGELREKDFRRMMTDNFYAASLLTVKLLPVLRKQESGQLLYLGCSAASEGHQGLGAFGASKLALKGFVQSLQRDLKDTAIRSEYLELAPANTGIWDELEEAYQPQTQNTTLAVARKILERLAADNTTPREFSVL